jgi:uncharacterized lipoprotein YajG
MKKIYIQFLIISISLPLLTGCSKTSSTALSSEKIPAAMNEAFKQSSDDTKAMVSECVTACQSQNVTTAFTGLQRLSQSKDLTPEQRAVTARAMAATFQKLRAASDNGDAAAQAVLHQYISTR